MSAATCDAGDLQRPCVGPPISVDAANRQVQLKAFLSSLNAGRLIPFAYAQLYFFIFSWVESVPGGYCAFGVFFVVSAETHTEKLGEPAGAARRAAGCGGPVPRCSGPARRFRR